MNRKMIKFYLKIQNNMLFHNLLYIISFLVIAFNIVFRILPEKFISFMYAGDFRLYTPIAIYTWCDGYLLILFVILIFFFIGTDFNNSMEDIGLTAGGSRTNKFFVRKLASLLLLYLVLYAVTFINIYTIYFKLLAGKGALIPLYEILFYSVSTNIFVISLSLFILFLSRDIAVSTAIFTAYYLIEELLWRCKITQERGILGHIYQYYDYPKQLFFREKLIYLLVSLILLFITYQISKRKGGGRFLKFSFSNLIHANRK